MTTITALPSPPSTSDPANFATEADAFIAALPTFVTETNTVAGEVNTNAATATTKAAEALASANNAAASTAFAMRWNFDSSTTMADPGAGDLRLNNATLASVTTIAVSASSADTGNPNVRNAVLTWDDSTNTSNRGTLTLRKIGTPGTFAQYAITGAVTDNTAWLRLTVTYITGNGSFSNADGLAVGFARTGDQGSTTGGNLSTALNYARATVDSAATTANIWAATGNQINWTGTTTCTGFPAAPQAGAERVLITAGAAPFTAGANMLIDGVTSGNTYTCAAGDTVTVRAITTTQFKLTIQKQDGTAVASVADGSLLRTTTFTSSETWNKGTGTRNIRVRGVAGGGSGRKENTGAYGGGGGAGGYFEKFIDVTSISSVSVTIGTGGAAQTTAYTDGNAGGTTSFGVHCSATGGSGGQAGGGAGGTATGGDINIRGGHGFRAVTANSIVGRGGDSALGFGSASSALSVPGYGGGGYGAAETANSGAGGGGIVIVEEYA